VTFEPTGKNFVREGHLDTAASLAVDVKIKQGQLAFLLYTGTEPDCPNLFS
jgi:hypothetical protein